MWNIKTILLIILLVAMLVAVALLLSDLQNSGTASNITGPSDKIIGSGVAASVDNSSVVEAEYGRYNLKVDGLVITPLTLTYTAITQYPAVTEGMELVCPGVFRQSEIWTGVPVSIILEEAGIKPEAKTVTFYASDGYTSSLTLDQAKGEGVFLAYKINGRTMQKADGGPVRLVARGMDGDVWVQFLERIEVS